MRGQCVVKYSTSRVLVGQALGIWVLNGHLDCFAFPFRHLTKAPSEPRRNPKFLNTEHVDLKQDVSLGSNSESFTSFKCLADIGANIFRLRNAQKHLDIFVKLSYGHFTSSVLTFVPEALVTHVEA